MIVLYYIGGPMDMHKRTLQANPQERILVRHAEQQQGYDRTRHDDVVSVQATDHIYITRKVGRDTFVAVEASLA